MQPVNYFEIDVSSNKGCWMRFKARYKQGLFCMYTNTVSKNESV